MLTPAIGPRFWTRVIPEEAALAGTGDKTSHEPKHSNIEISIRIFQ